MIFFACNNPKSIKGDTKYLSLQSIPDYISVKHNPTPALAKLNGRSGSKYTWIYKTSVSSPNQDIKIIEFGSFGSLSGKWVFSNYTNKPFTPKNFEDWYNCPNAILKAGQTYTDINNWSGSEELESHTSLWYFIGQLPNGKKVKGFGIAKTLGKLLVK